MKNIAYNNKGDVRLLTIVSSIIVPMLPASLQGKHVQSPYQT
jgi:hypothetical protein